MSQLISVRGARLLKTIDYYMRNHKGWDSSNIFPRIKIDSFSDGKMKGSFEVTEDICNPVGTLHGGFISSSVDTLCVFSFLQHPEGTYSFTTDMNISYLDKALVGETIDVETSILTMNNKRVVVECLLSKGTERSLVAKGTVGVSVIKKSPIIKRLPFDYTLKD